MNYLSHLFIISNIYLGLSLGLQLTFGHRGILNLSHSVPFGVAGYVFLSSLINGYNFYSAFYLAFLFTFLLSVLLTLFIKNSSAEQVNLITFIVLIIFANLAVNLKSVTGGVLGLNLYQIQDPNEIVGFITKNSFIIFPLINFLFLFLLVVITKSRLGLWWKATKENYNLSQSFGVNLNTTLFFNMALSSFSSTIFGILYVIYIQFLDPSVFGLNLFILTISIVIFGGLESWFGTILATFTLTLLPEVLRFLPVNDMASLRNIVYALIILFVLYVKPNGLLGNYKFV